MQLKEVGEFQLIDIIARQTRFSRPSVVRGIGDDAAVVKTGGEDVLLVTADMLVEGVHFSREHTSPYLLGKKSLAVNLSDIAAMGGIPQYYTASISVPSDTPLSFIKRLYKGMHWQASRFHTVLLGGDTSAAPERLSIAITVLGTTSGDNVVYRCGARQGDLIYVSGSLGDAALGLAMLRLRTTARRHPLVRKQLDPVPRLALAQALARARLATSMIDISDGLVADLRHILSASGAGARINVEHLPLSRSYRTRCPELSRSYLSPALCGGEDYELLFTVLPQHAAKVEKLAKNMQTPCACIGHITGKKSGLMIADGAGREVEIENEGYRHF